MLHGSMRAFCAVLIAVLLVVYFVWPRTEQAPPTAPAAPPSAPAVDQPAVVTALPGVIPLQEARPGEPTLRMPDGKEFPMLNGVREAPPPSWEPGRPYSPIIGTRTIRGLDYYVHADGSTTTTLMAWRTDLKRYDGTTRVESPKESQAIVEDPTAGPARK